MAWVETLQRDCRRVSKVRLSSFLHMEPSHSNDNSQLSRCDASGLRYELGIHNLLPSLHGFRTFLLAQSRSRYCLQQLQRDSRWRVRVVWEAKGEIPRENVQKVPETGERKAHIRRMPRSAFSLNGPSRNDVQIRPQLKAICSLSWPRKQRIRLSWEFQESLRCNRHNGFLHKPNEEPCRSKLIHQSHENSFRAPFLRMCLHSHCNRWPSCYFCPRLHRCIWKPPKPCRDASLGNLSICHQSHLFRWVHLLRFGLGASLLLEKQKLSHLWNSALTLLLGDFHHFLGQPEFQGRKLNSVPRTNSYVLSCF